ncbi:MAG: calcium-translocating P-type ATPase, SERCA-type [Firmicutes bacterium]|jgi:Ca2+-transporting ATPase|nr:calcium-translocating P-type ATPase, SERCA-type [Bacillota bacterium]
MKDYSLTTPEETLRLLGTDPEKGLSASHVAAKLEEYGRNELKEKKRQTVWEMFLSQFKEFLILLLLGAALISILLGEITDAVVIFLIVFINAIFGVVQEFKAEKALEALKTLSAPKAKVWREGTVAEVPAADLVPGDIVLLEAGDFIPADARLLETVEFRTDESALTGESVPVEKDAADLPKTTKPLAERKNMVYMGTIAVAGRARAVVTATGMETEIGRIAGMIQETEAEMTPLQKKLKVFGQQLGLLVILICIGIFALGVFRGNNPFGMFMTAVTLAVAAVPEGLPAIVTIVLALGVQRMAARNAIIRRLSAVEALGAATVICTDKTGTLTLNQMTVQAAVVDGATYTVTGESLGDRGEFLLEETAVDPLTVPRLGMLLLTGLLCNDARLIGEGEERRAIGDPTETALLVAAAKAGLFQEKMAAELPQIREYPFDSTRKRMSTIHRGKLPFPVQGLPAEGFWVFTKGAPDVLLKKCRRYLGENGIEELTPAVTEKFAGLNRELANRALRVLGLAFRPFREGEADGVEDVENDLIFLGFLGMIDPPRPEARPAIELCRKAGIKIKMITGDHRDTARAIAADLGLLAHGHEEDQVITGEEMDQLSEEELAARVGEIVVFARVTPAHKVQILEALKANGEIVAMTGDGVNDAPALKKADIGTAMGRTGTDVAKQASDMVLADDNFATIVRAVQEGRIIFENIKKAIYFLLSCNLGEVVTILASVLLGWPVPLIPIQILWVNLVTDSFPALALGVDPPEDGIMDRPPRPPQEGIFTSGVGRTLSVYGLFIAFITLIAFSIGRQESLLKGQSMAFITLSLCQLVHVFNFRSLHESVFKRGLFGNKHLLLGVLAAGLLQAAVLFIPFLREIFRVVDLTAADWLRILGLVLSPLVIGEIWKALSFHGRQG